MNFILKNRILKARRKLRCSQAEFGDLIGVTRQTIAKWEHGESVPDIRNVKKIAHVLGISIEDLLEEEERKKYYIQERYVMGKTVVDKMGRIIVPMDILEKMEIKLGEELLVFGDIERGIELFPEGNYWEDMLKKYL